MRTRLNIAATLATVAALGTVTIAGAGNDDGPTASRQY
jgi:hypothetical protein